MREEGLDSFGLSVENFQLGDLAIRILFLAYFPLMVPRGFLRGPKIILVYANLLSHGWSQPSECFVSWDDY